MADTEKCVASGSSGCDAFLKDRIKKKVSSALGDLNVAENCVQVCSANQCKNDGICNAETDGSYECQCTKPKMGDYCEESTCTLHIKKLHKTLPLSAEGNLLLNRPIILGYVPLI